MTITARCADERFHCRRVSQSPFSLDQIVGLFTELVHHRYLLSNLKSAVYCNNLNSESHNQQTFEPSNAAM